MKKQRINLFLKEEQLLSDAQMNVLPQFGIRNSS